MAKKPKTETGRELLVSRGLMEWLSFFKFTPSAEGIDLAFIRMKRSLSTAPNEIAILFANALQQPGVSDGI